MQTWIFYTKQFRPDATGAFATLVSLTQLSRENVIFGYKKVFKID